MEVGRKLSGSWLVRSCALSLALLAAVSCTFLRHGTAADEAESVDSLSRRIDAVNAAWAAGVDFDDWRRAQGRVPERRPKRTWEPELAELYVRRSHARVVHDPYGTFSWTAFELAADAPTAGLPFLLGGLIALPFELALSPFILAKKGWDHAQVSDHDFDEALADLRRARALGWRGYKREFEYLAPSWGSYELDVMGIGGSWRASGFDRE